MIFGKNKAGLTPVWAVGLNPRWLPGTIKKTIPNTLGKSIWLSAIASVPGTSAFLYQMGEANETGGSRTVRWGHVLKQSCHSCASATIVWDHCEGHLLAVGREEEMAGRALHGLKGWLN